MVLEGVACGWPLDQSLASIPQKLLDRLISPSWISRSIQTRLGIWRNGSPSLSFSRNAWKVTSLTHSHNEETHPSPGPEPQACTGQGVTSSEMLALPTDKLPSWSWDVDYTVPVKYGDVQRWQKKGSSRSVCLFKQKGISRSSLEDLTSCVYKSCAVYLCSTHTGYRPWDQPCLTWYHQHFPQILLVKEECNPATTWARWEEIGCRLASRV